MPLLYSHGLRYLTLGVVVLLACALSIWHLTRPRVQARYAWAGVATAFSVSLVLAGVVLCWTGAGYLAQGY